MKWPSSLITALDDQINPVVMKELRQAVQSRLVIAILFLFLTANVISVCGFILLSRDVADNPRAGQELFQVLYMLLAVTTAVFVPLYAAVRLSMERNDANVDLLFVTTLSPRAIIHGKFWAAVLLAVLIYSTCLPFLMVTYLLRGIDLPSIFFVLGNSFLMTTVSIMLAIFCGSVPGGLLIRLLLGGGLLWIGLALLIYQIGFGSQVVYMGLGWMFDTPEKWGRIGLYLLPLFTSLVLFYLLAVAAISPKSSNRMFPVRMFLTICWLIYGLVAAVVSWIDASAVPLQVWMGSSTIILIGVFALLLGERESWSVRIRRSIPRGLLGRGIAWLFYTGSAGGVLWASLLGAASVVTGNVLIKVLRLSSPFHDLQAMTIDLTLAMGYAWCYGMSGVLVRRLLFPRSIPLVNSLMGLVLFGVGASIPLLLAYFFLDEHYWYFHLPQWAVISNPIYILNNDVYSRESPLLFVSFWALFCLVANWTWFRQQWREFRHYESGGIVPEVHLAPEQQSAVVHV